MGCSVHSSRVQCYAIIKGKFCEQHNMAVFVHYDIILVLYVNVRMCTCLLLLLLLEKNQMVRASFGMEFDHSALYSFWTTVKYPLTKTSLHWVEENCILKKSKQQSLVTLHNVFFPPQVNNFNNNFCNLTKKVMSYTHCSLFQLFWFDAIMFIY